MSYRGILRRAGVNLVGPDGANDWNFEGIINARNIISRFAGSHFHVDSNHTNASDASGYGKRKDKPFATIDYAVGKCADNNADVIWVHAGHVEAVIAPAGLDLDVEGITIVFLGNGDDQAKITFGTDVDADMDVNADNITLVNPRFESAIDALTGPIDVNKANFTIINGEYYDAAGKAATDCIVAIATAKGLIIDGWKYFESTTGTQKESNIQLNGVDDLTLKNIDIRGDFDSSNIENITDEILNARLEDIYLDNLAPGPVACMKLDADCDGYAKNVSCRVASGTTYLSDVSDINWGPNCLGFSADGGSGESLGTALATGIEGKIDIIDGLADDLIVDIIALPKCIEKIDGAVLTGLDPLFTIAGGPVRAKIIGHVTTVIGGASNLRLQHITTDPAATVELNAGAVAVNTDAVGTVYYNLGATSVFTPSGGLGFVLLDPVTLEETEFILAPGVVQCLGSAAQSGVIKWYMSYVPLSPSSVVTAAA